MARLEKARTAHEQRDISAAKQAHTKAAIHHHEPGETGGKYLGEFVYGAIDGTVTTFAIVSGVAGAAFSSSTVLILGFANLLADGFSMACGNFLSERAQREYIQKERRREEWEIDNVPEGEIEEIRQIFRQKGFKGKDLERAVEIITADRKIWVDTMMTDELGLIPSAKSPWKTAGMTYFGFLLIGIIPLLAYLLAYASDWIRLHTFSIAIVLTAIALFVIGAIKRYVTKESLWISAFETVFIGGAAAAISYAIGYTLRLVIGL